MSGDRWAKHPVTKGSVTRDHLTTQGVDPEPETWRTGTETLTGDTTTARDALRQAICQHGVHDMVGNVGWASECMYASIDADLADHLLRYVLSREDIVRSLPGAAGLVRELDEARAVCREQETHLERAATELEKVRGGYTLEICRLQHDLGVATLALDEARAKLARPSVAGREIRQALAGES